MRRVGNDEASDYGGGVGGGAQENLEALDRGMPGRMAF